MNFFKNFDHLNKYLSFNIVSFSGWLYLPALIVIYKSQNPLFALKIALFHPVGIFLIIACLLTDIAFIIVLLEILNIKHLNNNFCLNNQFFKIFKILGILITIIFYIILIFKEPKMY